MGGHRGGQVEGKVARDAECFSTSGPWGMGGGGSRSRGQTASHVKKVPEGGAAQRPKMVPYWHCSRGSGEAGVTRGRKQSRTRGCGFSSRTDALEGPEQRRAGTKPRFKRSPLATVGEGPGRVKGGSWEPSGDAAAMSNPGRRWRLEGSDAGHLRGGAGSIS